MKRIDKPLNLLKKYWWLFLATIPLILVILNSMIRRLEKIAKEARMDKILDEYLKIMTNLLLQENSLLKSKKGDPLRNVARSQTITVVKRLDSKRNQSVFQFLQEANLISPINGDETEEAGMPIISLARADLKFANMEMADLTGVNLIGANLLSANLDVSDLQGADLHRADLSGASLIGANLPETNLANANLASANLTSANLTGGDLAEADLTVAYLFGAILTEANLTRARMIGAHLQIAKLKHTKLQGANLEGADLQEADLQEADLQGAYLRMANLQEANLLEANLQGAIFTDISSMIKKGYLEGTTMPDGTIFSESTDLEKFTEPTEEE